MVSDQRNAVYIFQFIARLRIDYMMSSPQLSQHCSKGNYQRLLVLRIEAKKQQNWVTYIIRDDQRNENFRLYSLSVLLSAVVTTRATQTVLAPAWWPLSEIIRTRVCAAALTTRGYYSRVAFISFKSFGLCGYYLRAATIWGWCLFEELR